MKNYIIANWKMYNLTLAEVEQYAKYFAEADINSQIKQCKERGAIPINIGERRVDDAMVKNGNWYELPKDTEIIICPQFPYLALLKEYNKGYNTFILGAQNCSKYDQGAHTGEISAFTLSEMGVRYVIIGHSERRIGYHEESEAIRQKLEIAARYKLTPILCVGEPLEYYERKKSFDYIRQQLSACLPKQDVIIAYEPIWAIGSGLTPTQDEISKFAFVFKREYNNKLLYGGSVNAEFASRIGEVADIDGLLVGYASTQPEEFKNIALNFCRSR